MRKRFFMISAISLITLVLLCIPIQNVQAYGAVFEEGTDGFSVSPGTTLISKYTYISTLYSSSTGIRVGDKVRMRITATNNSNTLYSAIPGGFWFADTIYGIIDFYNSTNSSYHAFLSYPNTVRRYESYNASTAMSVLGGIYNYYDETTFFYIIPSNFTAANHTIIDVVDKLIGPISYTAPPGPTVKGTWTIWNGNPTTPGSQKFVYEFNSRGILTKHQWYTVVTTDWELHFEVQLEPDFILLLMLSQMTGGGGGGLMIGDYIGIGIIVAIIFVPLAIGLGIRKSSGK